MEPAQKQMNPEFARGIAYCLGIIDGIADGIRNNPAISHAERIAIDKALTIITNGFREALKDTNDAQS